MKTGLKYLLAYTAWVVVMALGIWFLLLSRDAVLGIAAGWVTQDSTSGYWQLTTVERFYVIAIGLLWIAVMITSEVYFRHGVSRGRLGPRFARFLGPELLLLFVADLALLLEQGLSSGIWSRWIILGLELGLGVLLVLAARSSPSLKSDLLVGD